jgi:hypothetical protein
LREIRVRLCLVAWEAKTAIATRITVSETRPSIPL